MPITHTAKDRAEYAAARALELAMCSIVKEYKVRNSLTDLDLGKQIGIHANMVQRLYHPGNRGLPKLVVIMRMADLVGMTVSEFVSEAERRYRRVTAG